MKRWAAVLALLAAATVVGGEPVARAACGRMIVLSAFPAEMDPLLAQTQLSASVTVDHHTFYEGTLHGHAVALALTGIGLTNAEATTLAALDRYGCGSASIVFSGVSGGRSGIGDVAIPARWTADDGGTWYPADGGMLDVATAASHGVSLAAAVPANDPACVGSDPAPATTISVAHDPVVIAGGDGRSADPFGGRALPCYPGAGDVFGCAPCRAHTDTVSEYAYAAGRTAPFLDPSFFAGYFQNQPPQSTAYDAEDMETAAVARVAWTHAVPFIAFRSLSDGQGDPLMLPGFPFQFFFYRQLAAENAAAVALAFIDAWPA